jgi:hypothetical protein
MTDSTAPGQSLGDRLRDVRLIEEALVRAVRDALRRHKQAGNRIAVWRDGRVVLIEPEDIPVATDP